MSVIVNSVPPPFLPWVCSRLEKVWKIDLENTANPTEDNEQIEDLLFSVSSKIIKILSYGKKQAWRTFKKYRCLRPTQV